jgi:hypothetical protein
MSRVRPESEPPSPKGSERTVKGAAEGMIHVWASLLERLARATVRRPWAFIVFAMLSSVPALYLASRLELKSSFIDLLSTEDPEVKDLQLVLQKTGGLGFSTIAIQATDRPRAEKFAVQLAERLERLEGVKFVQARLEVEFLEDRQLYYLSTTELEELTKEVKAAIDHRVRKEAGLLLDEDEAPPVDPLDRIKKEGEKKDLGLAPFLVGSDGKYLYVILGLGGSVADLGATSRVQAEVERVARESADELAPGIEVLFTGPIVNRREDAKFLGEDLSRAGIVGFVGVVVIVLVATRKRRPVLLLALPLALGLSWTFAFAYLTVRHLNAVSGFLVSILSGLGIEYGIHLYKRYVEERRRGRDPHESTLRMLRSTGGALLAACLVNASVFAVVAVAGFRGFMEFGLIASVGMLLTMAATLLLFPALNYLMDRRWPVFVGERQHIAPIVLPAFVRYAVLAAVPLLAAYSVHAIYSGKVRFHTDWRELGADTPASRLDAYVIKTLDQSVTQVMLYLEEPGQSGAVRDAVEVVRTSRTERGLPFNVVRVVGVDDVIPSDQAAKAKVLAELKTELARVKPSRLTEEERPLFERAKRMCEVSPFTLDDVPRSLKQRFLTVDGTGTMGVITTNGVFEESRKLIDWSEQVGELRAELAQRKVSGALASENAIAGRIFRIITESGGRILAATFLVVFIVLLFEFRKLLHALAVLGSVAVGMLFVAGGMGAFGIELNFMNAAVLPIIVGVSLDNAIHIFHRYVEEGPASIPLVMRRTGSAALLSSSTNLAGFAALLVARHGGLRSVAELSVLGIVATVFTTTAVFPIALDLVGRLRGHVSGDESPASSRRG